MSASSAGTGLAAASARSGAPTRSWSEAGDLFGDAEALLAAVGDVGAACRIETAVVHGAVAIPLAAPRRGVTRAIGIVHALRRRGEVVAVGPRPGMAIGICLDHLCLLVARNDARDDRARGEA